MIRAHRALRRRLRLRHRRRLSNAVAAPTTCALFEPLEPRVLFSASVDVPTGFDINPLWFAEVSPAHATPQTGGSALNSIGLHTATVNWDGVDMESIADQWIIRLDEAIADGVTSLESIVDLLDLNTFGAHVVRGLGLEGMVLLETDSAADTDMLITTLKTHDLIAYAQPNVIIDAQLFATDPSFGSLYGLHNTGQSGGTVDADIDAPEAWNLTTGSSSVVVGVIDTGIDYTHPDLAANMWTNPGEIAGNGIDDDGNGFVDDIHGFNFVDNNGNPMDDNGHGTHVAGTIAAAGNNGVGIVGVTWSTSLMALKFLDAGGSGSTADAVRAVNYATMMRTQYGVDIRVTNNSWGGGGASNALRDAIIASQAADMLFIAAAGNDGTNNDVSGHYPSNYDLDAVISVAATDRRDQLASFSNYGATTVDVAAPGVSILSTVPGGYASYSGTSMASPHVAGIAALAFAYAPDASAAEVKDAILAGADSIDSLAGKMVTGGRVNAYNTLTLLDTEPFEPGDPDAYEDNDSRDQVDALAAGTPGSANLGLIMQSITVNNLGTDDGDDDWFRFEMNGTGRGGDSVRIDFDNDGGNLDLTVYASDGSVVGNSATNDDFEVVDLAGEAPGVYYAHIRSRFTSGNENYSLTINPGAAGGVSGVVFNDLDADGELEAGESGIEGITVYIDANNNGLFDASQMTVSATGLPIPVPSIGTKGTAESQLTVAGAGGSIIDVNVMIDMTHTWDSDLTAFLVSPTGTRVELFSNVGGSGDGFRSTFLDDEAAQSITAGSAPFTGTFRPEGSLADFDGESANGGWTLEIADDYTRDSGTLYAWALILTTSETAAVTDAQGNYSFGDLPDGDVVIRQVAPDGLDQTYPSGDGAHHLSIVAGQLTTGANFGLAEPVAPTPPPPPPATAPLIEVRGAGTLITDGDTTPDDGDGTDFGAVDAVFGIVNHSFTIHNAGDGALDLTGDNAVTVTGEGFTLVSAPDVTSLDPGESVTFTVRFDPTQLGAHEGMITIASNDEASPVFDFVIAGEGIAPDLAPQNLEYAAGEYSRGAAFNVGIDVTNLGEAEVAYDGDIMVEFRLTMDDVWGNGDDVVLGTRVLAAGVDLSALAAVQLQTTLGDNIAAGAYHLAAKVDAADAVDETDETNNVIISAQADVVVADNVVIELVSGQAVTFTDADGTLVRVRLTGGGSGQLILSAASNVDADAITLTGTTDRSVLRIDGDTTIGSITIDGDMRQVRGTEVDLLDALTVTGGLKSLVLDDVTGATIETGAFENPADTMTVTLGDVTDSSFMTAADVRTFRVASWTDTDASADTFTAATVATLRSDGGFEAEVNIDRNLTTARIAGEVRGDWYVGEDASNVRVGGWVDGLLSALGVGRLTSDSAFAADLDVADDLGRVVINGMLGSGDAEHPVVWTIGGAISNIKADAVNGFVLNGDSQVDKLNLGAVENALIDIADAIGTVKVTYWQFGILAADAVSSLRSDGDFLAELILRGAAEGLTLGTARIDGTIAGTTWRAAGDVGTIRAFVTSDWSLNDADNVARLDLGDVADANVSVSGDIRNLRALAWLGGAIEAASIYAINVTGDFDAEVILTGAIDQGANTLNSARIGGTLGGSAWQVAGDVGTIRAAATADWSLTDAVAIRQLNLGDVTNVDVTAGGDIRDVRAIAWSGGSIEAATLYSLNVRGDFDASLSLTGAAEADDYTLRTARIGGLLSETAWRIAGRVNSIRAERTEHFSLTDVTVLSRLDLGEVVDAQVTVAGEIRTLYADAWDGGAIEAGSIRTLRVSGDLSAVVSLTDASAQYSLYSLTVRGAMNDTEVRSAGSINRVTAYSMTDSLVFAGVDDDVTGLPDSEEDFVNRDAVIKSINVSGRNTDGAALVDSVIAAWEIGRATLRGVQTDNNAVAFGMAASTVSRLALRDVDAVKLDPSGNTGDFRLREV